MPDPLAPSSSAPSPRILAAGTNAGGRSPTGRGLLRLPALLSCLALTLLLAACGTGGGDGDGPPSAPTNVRAEPGPGYVTVTWEDTSDDETGFVIYRDDGTEATALRGQAEVRAGEVGANAESFVDLGVSLGVDTTYRAVAENEHGESEGGTTSGTVRLEPGVDLMVGTNDRLYDDGTGTVLVPYYVLPETVLEDETVDFEIRIDGPAGWNDGNPIEYSESADASARSNGFGFLSLVDTDAVAGTYDLTVTVGSEVYTASATLADADYKLGPPTNITVAEAAPSTVTVTWDGRAEAESAFVSIWRGNFEELAVTYRLTTDTTYTFEDLALTDGLYTVEVADVQVDLTTYPIKIDPFGIAYDGEPFAIGTVAACPNDPIEDPALADAVAEELELDGAPTCADLLTLQSLDAQDRDVASLEGLQYAPNLVELEIAENDVDDLSPLQGLQSLQLLNARDNPNLSEIGVLASLPSLDWLSLSRTAVRDVSVLSEVTNLEAAELESLEIDDADLEALADLAHMRAIGLEDNQVSDLTVIGGLTTLQELELQENEIDDLSPLSALTDLRQLRLGNNLVTDISALAGLAALTQVWLGDNPVDDVAALQGKELVTLDLGSTQVSSDDIPVLSTFDGLEELMICCNGEDFADMSWLEGLDLAELHYIDNGVTDVSVLEDMTNLEYLALGWNPIADLTPIHGHTQLVELLLPGLELEDADIAFLTSFDQLENLDVASNDLTDIDPLVDNAGLGEGDLVQIDDNLLDLNDGSDAMEDIQELIDRGAEVEYEPQQEP